MDNDVRQRGMNECRRQGLTTENTTLETTWVLRGFARWLGHEELNYEHLFRLD